MRVHNITPVTEPADRRVTQHLLPFPETFTAYSNISQNICSIFKYFSKHWLCLQIFPKTFTAYSNIFQDIQSIWNSNILPKFPSIFKYFPKTFTVYSNISQKFTTFSNISQNIHSIFKKFIKHSQPFPIYPRTFTADSKNS